MTDGILSGRVLFLAGAGPQIGAATAHIAAREGARVALAARSIEVAEKIAAEVRAAGGDAIAVRCDLTRDDEVQAALDATRAQLGAIDTVFFNAAFYDNRQASIDIDDDVWDTSMEVNLNSAVRIARRTVPAMIERGGGSFVLTSSAASIVAGDTRFGYQVSKAGLNAVTRFIAGKYGREGIRANAVLPFVLEGPVGAAAAELNCLGRSPTAEEIGEAVVFLLSDRASIITGQVIHLDGGLFVRAPWPTPAAKPRP
ncbi:NAD(P)-dependent dehydrogenase, short-chain alcohol dehydrogenase family [Mycobacterium sp. 88mf]|uniref:SDR family oxidoreductase n=1 Tax=Mycolicibacterium septicum DSM 44393 TaxID=1341646 RepID=A0A7X6MME2_9MYCO|nr:SDR family oxidoreductase [Mycolicibacterium septicum]NKZ11285.1 SDR family oxidoreductase [Mycolicibacterium septicum DSM 44393]SER83720.1 NAD(P)-dependent dehydrogenase, short-chain alcohol dehydrogenase family [Mycobacterium sp. 88mf]SFG63970.1 NAD(P)-dependent dehydrogenase, short-chain alcohol dehydrogenase family [Mycobacterium sp. 455mf]